MNKLTPLGELLKTIVSKRASDLHLSVGQVPMMRVDKTLLPVSKEIIKHDQMVNLLKGHLSEEQFKIFENNKEYDFSFGLEGMGRFRVNLYYEQSNIACAIRALPFEPISFSKIGFPEGLIEGLANKPSGLILVTGATGSGKTTTLGAMVEYINTHRACHIVTMEDPIEFVFKSNLSLVHQREIGSDSKSFANALKYVLRQDPDVILVGEMRDLETIEIALNVAETGHLVLATLHTPDAVQSVNRIIDVFPAHQQAQVRVQFSFVLQAVICQHLLPKKNGGVVMAAEILLANAAVRSLIRDSKSHQIYSSIQMGQKEGMKTLNMSLRDLVQSGTVSKEDAYSHCSDIKELEKMLG